MSDAPVNLNRFRKEKAREEARRKADANSAKYGRTKAERSLGQARTEKDTARLDAHLREDRE